MDTHTGPQLNEIGLLDIMLTKIKLIAQIQKSEK